MKDALFIKLVEYLRENNPDILFSFQEDGALISYINDKLKTVECLLSQLEEQRQPSYIIEETCLEVLTEDLRPSKYNYIKELLEEEFLNEFTNLFRSGLLCFEIINIISVCDPLFEAFEFSGNEEDKNLRYTIIGTIKEYFENSERENRVTWPTMPTITLQ